MVSCDLLSCDLLSCDLVPACYTCAAPSDTFHIVPGERELPPGKTGAFTINFKPVSPPKKDMDPIPPPQREFT